MDSEGATISTEIAGLFKETVSPDKHRIFTNGGLFSVITTHSGIHFFPFFLSVPMLFVLNSSFLEMG